MNSDILRKLENGSYRVIKNKNSRSKIWNIFYLIEKDDGSIFKGILLCEKCNRILKYNGKQTSNLIRHKCYVTQNSELDLKKISQSDKENFLSACLQWIIEDCRPFSTMNGEGFKQVIQSSLDIGIKYGSHVDISDMIPDPTTISQRISDIAKEKRSALTEELKLAIESGTASIACDVWTDDITKGNFLCTSFHFVKDLKLKRIVLGITSIDFQRCAANNLKLKLNSILQDFGIKITENITFVTEKGTNIVKALKDKNRINCAYHLLNNVLDTGFNNTQDLQPFFENCRKLANYLSQTSLNHIFSGSPEDYCVTKWNSHFQLITALANNYSQIEELLSSTNEKQRISNISLWLLKALVEIIEKLEIVSKKLQEVNCVTINYVYLTIGTLKTICEEKKTDFEVVLELKRNILKEIDNKYVDNLNIIHYAACFLYPPTNNCLNAIKLNEVKEYCVSEIMKSVPFSSSPTHSPTFDEPPKDFTLFFPNFTQIINPSATESISDEVERYSYLRMNIDMNFNVLQWWQNHSSEYPRLYKIAQQILSIPASSTAPDRVFTTAGNIITEKQNSFCTTTVNNLLFLNSLCKYE